MSHRLATCAACNTLSFQLDVTEDQSAQMYDFVGPSTDSCIQWRFRVLICQHCRKPVISLWPFEDDVNGVMGALGMPTDSLHAPEKGGKR